MKRNLATRSLHTRNRLAQPRQPLLTDPNELKSLIRDGLVSMNMAEREEFIQSLETEMRRTSLNMRAYLVPLGIPGRSPEDLTRNEPRSLNIGSRDSAGQADTSARSRREILPLSARVRGEREWPNAPTLGG